MKRRENDRGIYAYLEGLGILENGTEEEIREAKRVYRKGYNRRYMRQYRQENAEYKVLLSRHSGEYGKIKLGAKRHHQSIGSFLKSSTLAYLSQTFLVPDHSVIASLQQLLISCLNEIQAMANTREKYSWDQDMKLDRIEKRIEKLEQDMETLFSQPPSIERAVGDALAKNPELRLRLLELLNHDHQD